MSGMTLIVKNMARLVVGFVALYGLYIIASGHAAPGGGFSGGVVIMAGVILLVLAFGGDATRELTAEWRCQWISGLAALLLVVALTVKFLVPGVLPEGPARAIAFVVNDSVFAAMVAAGLVGLFLGLVVATRQAMPGLRRRGEEDAQTRGRGDAERR